MRWIWMEVNHHVGDALIYDIYTEDTGQHVVRSNILSADPRRWGIPNLRVPFSRDDSGDKENPESKPPEQRVCPILKQRERGTRTNKHKVPVTFQDAEEPPPSEDNQDVEPKEDTSSQAETDSEIHKPRTHSHVTIDEKGNNVRRSEQLIISYQPCIISIRVPDDKVHYMSLYCYNMYL